MRDSAPPVREHNHFLKMSASDDEWMQGVRSFGQPVLARGGALVLIARPSRVRLAEHWAAGIPGTGLPIHVVDADELLEQLCPRGALDRQAFFDAVNNLHLAARKAGNGEVAFVGEMVDLLWQQGRERETLSLEEYWDEFIPRSGASLLCMYTPERNTAPGATLLQIFRMHRYKHAADLLI